MIRRATTDDLDALVALEEESFQTDRLSRASYRRLVQRPSAVVLVVEDETSRRVIGSAVVLFREGLAAARLYSIAIDPQHRGRGVGRMLLEAAMDQAIERERLLLRLEVREDNEAARKLYERSGFHRTGYIPEYYEDGAGAVRYERTAVAGHEPPQSLHIPYYAQTLDFTCGAACLMMALAHFRPEVTLTRALEIELWREATTVFMTSGIGGCSAHGLAVAALNRGLHAAVITSDPNVPFIDSVRSQEKKEVLRIVHRSFLLRLSESGHSDVIRGFGAAEIRRAVDMGIVPVLLVSGYRLYGEKQPHWVVVTGYDAHFVYMHDPYIPTDVPEFDGHHVPIHERDFTLLHRYGRTGIRTMVLLYDQPIDDIAAALFARTAGATD